MKVTEIFIYPVKSLRGISVDKATIETYGFKYDRNYMLIRDEKDAPNVKKVRGNMIIGLIPEMALFTQSMELPNGSHEGKVVVTFNPPDGEASSITLPLVADITGLKPVQADLYSSTFTVYDMGSKYNDWFSERFGWQTRLVTVGSDERAILFPSMKGSQASTSSWIGGITKNLPIVGNMLAGTQQPRLKFQDCANFLVTNQKSNEAISDMLDEGVEYDYRKLRPNFIVSGQRAWEEDFWGEITIGTGEDEIKVSLQHNCLRCQSLNVDYKTGKYSDDKNLQVLKLLQKDRRIDTAKKYNAAFGRYGFVRVQDVGKEVKVGDIVEVTKVNDEHTGFDWPGL